MLQGYCSEYTAHSVQFPVPVNAHHHVPNQRVPIGSKRTFPRTEKDGEESLEDQSDRTTKQLWLSWIWLLPRQQGDQSQLSISPCHYNEQLLSIMASHWKALALGLTFGDVNFHSCPTWEPRLVEVFLMDDGGPHSTWKMARCVDHEMSQRRANIARMVKPKPANAELAAGLGKSMKIMHSSRPSDRRIRV